MAFNLCFLLSSRVQLGSWAFDGHAFAVSLPREQGLGVDGTSVHGVEDSEGRRGCAGTYPRAWGQISPERNWPVRAPAWQRGGGKARGASVHLLVGSQKTGNSTETWGTGSTTAPAPPPGCNGVSSPWSWLTLLPTQLPSAKGRAHAWHAVTFSTASCGPATPELASHHLSESAWMCPHLPFLERSDCSCGARPGSQRPRSGVQRELLSANCLLWVRGGAGSLPTPRSSHSRLQIRGRASHLADEETESRTGDGRAQGHPGVSCGRRGRI